MAELTQEQKDYFDEQQSKMGEIFSQCWESEEFKKGFIADPKAFFEEYGVAYDKDKNYVIIDTPAKTVINVLPYKGVKGAVKAYTDKLMKYVEDLADDDEKQVLLPGWCWTTYQNTEDTIYLPLPISPESLSPEELEMINGGCVVIGIVFLVGFAAVAGAILAAAAETAVAVTTVAAVAELATVTIGVTATVTVTGSFVLNGTLAVDTSSGVDAGSSTGAVNH